MDKADIERSGVGEQGYHKPSELSGGQQQESKYCKGAFVGKPKIVFADEPTGTHRSKPQ